MSEAVTQKSVLVDLSPGQAFQLRDKTYPLKSYVVDTNGEPYEFELIKPLDQDRELYYIQRESGRVLVRQSLDGIQFQHIFPSGTHVVKL